MKFITHNSEEIALILARPNWRVHPRVTVALPFTDIETALSHRESRRNFGRSTRYAFEYTPRFKGAGAATEFRIGLTRLKTEPVAVPLWTDAVRLSNAVNAENTILSKTAPNPVRYGSEWIVLLPDAQAWNQVTYEIVTVTSVTDATITLAAPGLTLNWPAGTLMYPLLFGRFAERPKLKSITPQTVEGGLKFIENSPYTRRLNVLAGSMATVGGNIPELSTQRLWNIEPEYSELLDTTEADIIYKALGFLRQEQQYEYAQFNRRGLDQGIKANSRAKIANAERIFLDRRGPVKTLMVPTFRSDFVLTQNLPIDGFPNLVTIEASEFSDATRPPHPGDPYMALLDPPDLATGLTAMEPVRVINVLAGNLATDEAVTQSHTPSRTRVSQLLLVHFSEAKMVWEYSAPGRAETRLKFIEVPDEYEDPAPDLPEPVFIYKFSEMLPVPQVSWFTSYEQAYTYGVDVCAPAPFEHGSIKQGLRLDQEKVDLTSWGGNFPTNPLAKFLPYSLDAELFLDIIEVDFVTGFGLVLFSGSVWDLTAKGVNWKATCVAFGRLFERKFPRFLISKTDNHIQFSEATQIEAADFKIVGTIDDLDGTEIEVTGPDEEIEWFSGGWLETGIGANFERRAILHSEPITGGQLIVVNRPLANAIETQSIDLYPGYNGSLEQCTAKFDNRLNFGGHAFVPDTNPAIKAVEAQQVQGGKK